MRLYALLIMRRVLNVCSFTLKLLFTVKKINSAHTMKSYEELEM